MVKPSVLKAATLGTVAAILGAVTGAISLSCVMYLLFIASGLIITEFDVMYLLFSVPAGAVLGIAVGVASVLQRQRRFRAAGVLYIIFGGVVAVPSFLQGVLMASHCSTIQDWLRLAISFGLLLGLAVWCMAGGQRLLRK